MSRTAVAYRVLAWVVGVNLLAFVSLIWVVLEAHRVIGWILMALLLALALDLPVRWLRGWGMQRGPALAVVITAALGVLLLFARTLVPMFFAQGARLVQAAPDLLDQLKHSRPFEWATPDESRHETRQ